MILVTIDTWSWHRLVVLEKPFPTGIINQSTHPLSSSTISEIEGKQDSHKQNDVTRHLND